MASQTEIIETEVEDYLGVNHPKLEAFQKAVEATLKKRLQQAEEELDFLRKENVDKKQGRAKQTTALHETQRLLKLEQRKLKKVSEETQAITKERINNEKLNHKYEQKLKELKPIHQKAKQKHDQLRERYNRAVAAQIILTTRRVNTAGSINATHTEASKAEEDFRKLQEQKKAQDLYLNKLIKDQEDLDQKALDYQAQADAMLQQSEEIMNIVRKSEEETEKVRLEKIVIMQKWTTGVINLSKRDEALEGFRIALKKQDLALKSVKAEIEGTKEDIIVCQEKHEQLTTLSQKAERLCMQRKNQIKKVEGEIEKAKLELNKAHEAHLKTQETLNATQAEAADLDKELSNTRNVEAKLSNIKTELLEATLQLDRDQLASDKSTTYAQKQIQNLRDKTKHLEDNLIEAQNEMSTVIEDIMSKTAIVDHQEEEIQSIEYEVDALTKLLDQIESGLLKAQALIDKKQNLIDMKTKEREELILAKNGAALSPLEADIERVKQEIEHTQDYCSAAKKAWLKYQNELIELINKRTSLNESLTELTRRYLIMQEKKMKSESDIEAMIQQLAELKRRIETKNNLITRINKQYSEEKTHYNNSLQSIEAKRALEVNKMSDLVSQVEAIKVEVEHLAKEVEAEKLMAIQAADELVSWEQQVKSSSETKSLVHREKDNLEALKTDLHRRQVRAEQVAKSTKELMDALANTVSRRETLVDRAVATSAHRSSQRPQTTRILVTRKIDDMRNKLKKLAREEKDLAAEIAQNEAKENELENELDRKQDLIRQLHHKSEELNAKLDSFLTKREIKMNELLALQTRAKWYRSIKVKKYKMSVENDDVALNEIIQLREQNADIKKLMAKLQEEYPYYKRSIQKSIILLD